MRIAFDRGACGRVWSQRSKLWSGGGGGGVASERADCVVIGAGVVGAAVAREVARRGRDVLLVEAGPTFGTATSSRNSEVVHAGIYYPPSSLKASLCVRGRELLYKYCLDWGIWHKKVGKLIVATSDGEVARLEEYMKRGTENGVENLRMLEGFEAMKMEPELKCVKALFSPHTGIVDSHSLMLSLLGQAESCGTTISYNSTVTGGHVEDNVVHLHVCDSSQLSNCTEPTSALEAQLVLIPKLVINCGGLAAPSIARRLSGLNRCKIPQAYFARGCYFILSKTGESPFKRLIYPLPEEGGVGVHVTLDMDGQVRFGPDVEWIDGPDDDFSKFLNRFDYTVQESRGKRFYAEIRKYYPNLRNESLLPGYAGIRPKLSGPGQPPMDFLIQGEDVHGVQGLVNLFGIESPGLTSSLAIAEYIAAKYLN